MSKRQQFREMTDMAAVLVKDRSGVFMLFEAKKHGAQWLFDSGNAGLERKNFRKFATDAQRYGGFKFAAIQATDGGMDISLPIVLFRGAHTASDAKAVLDMLIYHLQRNFAEASMFMVTHTDKGSTP